VGRDRPSLQLAVKNLPLKFTGRNYNFLENDTPFKIELRKFNQFTGHYACDFEKKILDPKLFATFLASTKVTSKDRAGLIGTSLVASMVCVGLA
jgi:hypothetical protein